MVAPEDREPAAVAAGCSPIVTFTLLVDVAGAPAGGPPDEATLEAVIHQLMVDGQSSSHAAKEAARRTGASRNDVYRIAMNLEGGP